ncbi:2-C-methyl-D-erythritol 4-phosphate cytidylyltransferase [Prevotella sp. P6B4]|uniref:IspD/TarI family cytidylyltransferase n=1 Tax=Prevotella sp. P6B4 TaxID=1410614 RepID=UPI00048CC5C7|nr:IspD/TarI family cytidylyltransferase [Prevotella sp. P6B4]
MNIAVIFAGGQGNRLNYHSRPKQFFEFRGKPIVVYTIEVFQHIQEVDAIVVVCLEDWIPYLRRQVENHDLTKVVDIVPGGSKGQDSIYHGLVCAKQHYPEDSMVLIHDGVRPLAMEKTIIECIEVAKEKGNCIVCVPAMETIVTKKADGSLEVPDRNSVLIARAPQCFVLKDVLEAHQKALAEDRHDFVDTCSMMNHYGYELHTILGTIENIKITTPADYFMFKAIIESREESAVFGF